MPTFSRGQWTQHGSGTLTSAVWKSTGVETLQHGEVIPLNSSLGDFIKGRDTLQGAFNDNWATGAWDTFRSQLIWTSGTGDQAYASNEVDAFDVPAGVWNSGGRPMDPPTQLWVKNGQVWNAGTVYGSGPNTTAAAAPWALKDTTGLYHAHSDPDPVNGFFLYPMSRQHYGGIIYMPSVDKFFMWGGFGWWASGSAMPIPFEWSPSTAKWQALTNDLAPAYGNGPLFAWDSALNRVLVFTSDPNARLMAYYPGNAHTNRWVTLQNNLSDSIPSYGASSFNYAQCVYDSKRNTLLMFGGYLGGVNPATGVVRWTFNGSGNVTATHQITITGDTSWIGQNGPGVLYDPVSDEYVGWVGGKVLHRVTPSSGTQMACVAFTPAGPTLPSASHFTWQKFAYLPTYDAYGVISDVTATGAFVFAPQRSAPSIAFTDLTEARRSGNTDTSLGQASGTHGAIVTLWGLNLGETQSTSTISVGGVTVPSTGIYYWGNAVPPYSPANLNNTYQRLQCIIFQVQGTTPLGAQNISITVGSFASNNQSITITNTGNFIYCKTTGSDALPATGSFSAPYRTLARCLQVAAASDVIYVGNGVATPSGAVMPALGAIATPLSIVAYPGADCQVGDTTHNAFQLNSSIAGQNVIYSKFNILGGEAGFPQTVELRDKARLVGSKIQVPNGFGSFGAVGQSPFQTSTNNFVFGCEFTNCGIDNPALFDGQYHVLYFSGNRNVGGPGGLESGREAAWNYFHDNKADRAINCFNRDPSSSSNALTAITLHDNVILNQEGDGILLGNGVLGTNYVYNNVLFNTGLTSQGGSGPHTGIDTQCSAPEGYVGATTTALNIYNNTLVNCGAPTAAARGTFEFRNSVVVTYNIYNNIFYQANGSPYLNNVTTTPPSDAMSTNNCWFGFGAPPAFAPLELNVNPQLVANAAPIDAHLRVTSQCIMAGTSPGVASNDLDGVARPTASAWDIGAFQFLSQSSPAPSIFNLSPSTKFAGDPGFTLTVNGGNFQVGAQVLFNGAIRTTVFVNSGQLTATILAGDIASPGSLPVIVQNPGGVQSASSTFTVSAAVTTSLGLVYNGKIRDRVGQTETALAADGALDGTFTATFHTSSGSKTITALNLFMYPPASSTPMGIWRTNSPGSGNFVLGAANTFDSAYLNNGTTMAVSFSVVEGQTFAIFASDYQSSEFVNGNVAVLVATLSDGSTSTGQVTIGAASVVPSLSSVSPDSGVPGDSVTLLGSNFVIGGNTVTFGSAGATITTDGTSSLVVTVPSLGFGTYNVTVTNTGGTSNPQTFTVIDTSPQPVFNTKTAFMYGQGL